MKMKQKMKWDFYGHFKKYNKVYNYISLRLALTKDNFNNDNKV